MSLILVVDDDENIIKMIEKQLSSIDYKVISALSGKKGVDLAKTGNPDLILLDLMMPEVNGFDVLKQLKKDEVTSGIPVIMLTSHSAREDVVSAMKMGVSDYIIKPHNIQSLSQKIATAIQYNKIEHEEQKAEEAQFINVVRKDKRTVISFKSELKDRKVLEEMKIVFNRGFLNITSKDFLVIDLRSLKDINENDASILLRLTSLFGKRNINIIAGRHYGIITAHCDFPDNVELFISPGDLELALVQKEEST